MPRRLTLHDYKGVDNTVENMFKLIQKHYKCDDLAVFDTWPIEKVFDFIARKLPYIPDPEKSPLAWGNDLELITAPYITMVKGGDCDDKTILAACIFERRGWPYRLTVVATPKKGNPLNTDLHHIYLEVEYRGKFRPFDATYPHNIIFRENFFNRKRIYFWNGASIQVYEMNSQNMNSHYSPLSKILGSYLGGSSAPLTTLGGAKLAILEGDHSNKMLRYRIPDYVALEIMEGVGLIGQAAPASSGSGPTGVIPVGTILAVSTAVVKIFGSMFAPERYQDAFNVWNAAAAALSSMPEYPAPDMWVTRALIAVLGIDYMNPPWGADYCTSPGRCGNRAEWAKIQPQVEAKAKEVAPFFYWLRSTEGTKKQPIGYPGWSKEGIYAAYKDYKSQGPLYQLYKSSGKTGSTLTKQAGGATTLLWVGGLAAAGFLLAHKRAA